MGETAINTHYYLQPIKKFSAEWLNDNQKWVQLYPYDTWTHPIYTDTTINKDIADQMVRNFNDGVIGKKVLANYEHGLDKAKGEKAAGEIVKVETREDGLWGLVQFNDIAKKEIDDGEWYYWSTSHYDSWTHPQDHKTYNYVLDGGALSNNPYVRGMVPLNFNDIFVDDDKKEFTVWTAKYVNSLPNSSFLFIDSKGDRHLPYKDASGNIDLAHLRNAIARAPQLKAPGADPAKLQAKARNLLKSHSTAILEEHLTTEEIEAVFEADPLLDNEVNDDEEIEGGDKVDEAKLRELLGIGEDVDVFEHIKGINEEVGPLREFKKEHHAQKKFSELYPDEAEELEAARTYRREQEAKRFSEAFATARITKKVGTGDEAKDEATKLGFSALVIDEINKHAKSFSEGKADLAGFKSVLDTIMSNGIVDYGTHGSSRDDESDEPANLDTISVQDTRKLFSDKVHEVMANDKVSLDSAYAIIAEREPELFKAYKERKPIASKG